MIAVAAIAAALLFWWIVFFAMDAIEDKIREIRNDDEEA